MRVLGVIDLLGGRAVHARAGRREDYARVTSVAGVAIADGDAVALAREYVDRLGVAELYVADLDAIVHRRPQQGVVAALARIGAPLWLDAGITSSDGAHDALALGAAQVIVGLETLTSYEALDEICGAVGGRRVAFSLDLRDGMPVPTAAHAGAPSPEIVASRGAAAGVAAVIVLDLARVGTGTGFDVDLVARVRMAAPDVMLFAGGGVRGAEDLSRLSRAGCDGALVGSALLDGHLTLPAGRPGDRSRRPRLHP
jgi:phosphoribosylformimino-5-aminoimidazole carboxamide ribotide isomerase